MEDVGRLAVELMGRQLNNKQDVPLMCIQGLGSDPSHGTLLVAVASPLRHFAAPRSTSNAKREQTPRASNVDINDRRPHHSRALSLWEADVQMLLRVYLPDNSIKDGHESVFGCAHTMIS
jgi:hypothetical protein